MKYYIDVAIGHTLKITEADVLYPFTKEMGVRKTLNASVIWNFEEGCTAVDFILTLH